MENYIETNALQLYISGMDINKQKHKKEKMEQMKLRKAIDKFTSANKPTHSSPNSLIKKEVGGFDGPEPTRFGDWEHNGRCTDF